MSPRIRADRRVGLLLGGVILLAFVAIGATVALPATDPELAAEPRELSAQAEHGLEVYEAQGCWYCHTQYVRNTSVDLELGEPLEPSAYEGLSPVMLGLERLGPDLTWVRDRFASEAELAAYLADPSETNGRTAMPSYAYLSADDLDALAAYLFSLPE